jgi:hypothetical protein
MRNPRLPPKGIDGMVWFAPHMQTVFQQGLLNYTDINLAPIGPVDRVEFIVFHELMEAYLKVDKKQLYEYKNDKTKGAHPGAIQYEIIWRTQLNYFQKLAGLNLFRLDQSGGRVSRN